LRAWACLWTCHPRNRAWPSRTEITVKTPVTPCTAMPPRPTTRVVQYPMSAPLPIATAQNMRFVATAMPAHASAATAAVTAAAITASGRLSGRSSYCWLARRTSCRRRSMQPGQTRSTTSFNNMGSLALVLPDRRQDAVGGARGGLHEVAVLHAVRAVRTLGRSQPQLSACLSDDGLDVRHDAFNDPSTPRPRTMRNDGGPSLPARRADRWDRHRQEHGR